MRGWEKFLVGEVLHQSENSTLSGIHSRGRTLNATFCLVISRTAGGPHLHSVGSMVQSPFLLYFTDAVVIYNSYIRLLQLDAPMRSLRYNM